jgi:hypothetical protein
MQSRAQRSPSELSYSGLSVGVQNGQQTNSRLRPPPAFREDSLMAVSQYPDPLEAVTNRKWPLVVSLMSDEHGCLLWNR